MGYQPPNSGCRQLGWVPWGTRHGASVRIELDFDRLFEEIRGFIVSQLASVPVPDYYRALAGQLKLLVTECDQRVTVLSTNWDTLLEDALMAEHGYRDMGTGVYRGKRGDHEIRLVKPHGSLGVARDESQALSHVSMADWLHPERTRGRVPLVALPGVAKRDYLVTAQAEYARRSWHELLTAFQVAECVISVGFGWHPADRDLLLAAKRSTCLPSGIALFNNADKEAVRRGAKALGCNDSADKIDTGLGIVEIVEQGVHSRAMDLLWAGGATAVGTWQAKRWLREYRGIWPSRNE